MPHKELITINIGGGGINLGQSTLEQYCVEHGISPDGNKEFKTEHDDALLISFRESINGTYTARSLFTDLCEDSINMMNLFYKYKNVIFDDYIVTGKEYGLFHSRGHYTAGKEIIDKYCEKLRLMAEECNNLQGFIINHSFGGTGSGYGALCLERVAVDYRKKAKIGFEIFLDEQKSKSPSVIYNTLLCIHWLLDHTEASIFLDNIQLHKICKNMLHIKTPRFKHYNYLCNKIISNITVPWRFGLREDANSFARDMTPFPRLHFLTTSLGNIRAKKMAHINMKYKDDIGTMTNNCLKSTHFSIYANDFDVEEDKYMSIKLNYRGNNIDEYTYDINKSVKSLRINKKLKFVEWCNDMPSVQYINSSLVKLPSDVVVEGDKQVTMIGNNTCISRLFSERICKKYDVMYSQRAYVHYHVGEGMESGEFAEAREDLGFLEKDYWDVLCEQNDDSDYDSED